jgi:8-oxo-dGTP pyrophosphatase MutT (NUDIX family)
MLKRKDNDLWEFPGGKLDPGESLIDCARREVLEETGIKSLLDFQFLHYFEHTGRWNQARWCNMIFEGYSYVPMEMKLTEPDKFYKIGWHSIDAMPFGKMWQAAIEAFDIWTRKSDIMRSMKCSKK